MMNYNDLSGNSSKHTLHLGDCRAVMATLDDNSIDAIVCDPPYELGFMGKAWDNSGIAYDVTVWQQCLRVLKPGGHLIAFGGSRTYHRLAVAIEDAGFEIRDQIQWIYGSGFPKSLDVSKAMDKQAGATREVVRTPITPHTTAGKGSSNELDERPWLTKARELGYHEHTGNTPSTDLAKQWQGWGTALKPAHEPAVLARKPLCGTVANNFMTWGVGGLNIDGTRIETKDNLNGGSYSNTTRDDDEYFNGKKPGGAGQFVQPIGRWPANVILDEDAAKALDEQSGGNVSRFFYTAKASKAEREAGLDGMEQKTISTKGNGLARTCEVCGANTLNGCECENRTYSNPLRANHHPTVKPLSLMRYLVRLVTPKGGKVLDPFMGSGSTGCASILEGFDFVGIDITPEYVAIAQKRIDHYAVTSPLINL
jgi:DNA modification methylase